MKLLKSLQTKHHFAVQTLCCLALFFASSAANTRCAYIFHDPEKPEELQLLKK